MSETANLSRDFQAQKHLVPNLLALALLYLHFKKMHGLSIKELRAANNMYTKGSSAKHT